MSNKLYQPLVPEPVLVNVCKMTAAFAGRMEQYLRKWLNARVYLPESTHQIRVLSRKCSTAWRVLIRVDATFEDKKIRQRLRAIRKALGPLRDADIRLEELQNFVSQKNNVKYQVLYGVLLHSWMISHAEAHAVFQKQWPAFQKTLAGIKADCKQCAHLRKDRQWRKRDRRWVSNQIQKWRTQAEQTQTNEQELHQFRIMTKRLRYLFQCLLPQQHPETQHGWLIHLSEMQEVVGRRRDIQNLLVWLGDLEKRYSVRSDKTKSIVASIQAWRNTLLKMISGLDQRWSKLHAYSQSKC